MAAPFAVTDSNKPGEEGPRVGTLGARVRNTGSTNLTNVKVHIGNGSVPGAFPSSSGGSLELLDIRDATHTIPALTGGEASTSYWPVTYPPTFDVGYGYTVWATADGCGANANSVLTTQSEISATSNKLQPTGGMILVSPDSAAPGEQITVQIIGFELGTIGQGPRPLSPYDAWLQPIGNLDFDPTCLRLVRSEVKLNSLSSTPYVDQLYFRAIGTYNSNPSDYVKYTFLALRDCSTVIQPYQEAASGTQEKYNADYGANRVTITSTSADSLILQYSSDAVSAPPGETVTLTAQINANGGTVGYPDNGSPIVLAAEVPADTTYVSGSATSTAPAVTEYSTDGGNTWQSEEPSSGAMVTDVRWILLESVDASIDTFTFDVIMDESSSGVTVISTASAGILDLPPLTTDDAAINGEDPTSAEEPTDPGSGPVQSGADGGLESRPLEGEPSDFLGGVGQAVEQDRATAAARDPFEQPHKAQLAEETSLKLEDLMPSEGPTGTTPQEAVPVDVLAFTQAPDAKAVDFVDGAQQVQAVALGILSVGAPYDHDYGVCNRFKSYTFEEIQPEAVTINLAGLAGDYWFWRARSVADETVREEAMTFHIFVDEAGRTLHIDSRWLRDDYPADLGYAYDYVFNMQVWSGNAPTTEALLLGILERLTELDGGTWSIQFHNEVQPVAPAVFIQSVEYLGGGIELRILNTLSADETIRLDGTWRNHMDRNTDQPFDLELSLPAGTTALRLPFPGLLDISLYIEHNGVRDKVYTGGGLWFSFANDASVEDTMTLGECRPLNEVDPVDLVLAGCAELAAPRLTGGEQIGLGRTLNPNGRPVDVSPYHALRFWARGNGSPIRILLETASVTDGDYYQTVITPTDAWQQFVLPLSAFAQRGFGETKPFMGSDVKAVIWMNSEATPGAFLLEIDQVSFTDEGPIVIGEAPANTPSTTARAVAVAGQDGVTIIAATLFYSVDDGRRYQTVTMAPADNGTLRAEIPGQGLGTTVLYYVEATHANGYISRTPLDAPASLHRYRVDDRLGLLVDDFAGERTVNRLGGDGGFFNNNLVGGSLRAYRSARQLVLDYAVEQEGQFAGYFTGIGEVDATDFTALNLLVRGQQGGEQLLVGLRDADGTEAKISAGDILIGGLIGEWQWLSIPLNAYAPELDRSRLTNVSLSFSHEYLPHRGSVYVKEVSFNALPVPVIVDTFDDDNLLKNGQGLPYGIAAPGGRLDVTLAADAFLPGGRSLRLDYEVVNGAYALWQTPLHPQAVDAAGALSFWVKGGDQPIEPHIYLADAVNRARVNLSDYVELSDRWHHVRIPLDAFEAQGIDVARLSRIEFVWEFAEGQGSLWIDNLILGNPAGVWAGQRTIHLTDTDRQSVAIHVGAGEHWLARSHHPAIVVEGTAWGPHNLTIHSLPWDLTEGDATTHVTLHDESGAVFDTITVQLTVTQAGSGAKAVYLPLIEK